LNEPESIFCKAWRQLHENTAIEWEWIASANALTASRIFHTMRTTTKAIKIKPMTLNVRVGGVDGPGGIATIL
jgi:hypothetical protein